MALIENIAASLATGITSGIVTGFYSGLVISRLIRFNTLQSEALRCLNRMEYMHEQAHIVVSHNDVNRLLPVITGELLHYGHKRAGEQLIEQREAITDTVVDAEDGRISMGELDKRLSDSYEVVRNMKPAYKIFTPWGRA